MENPNMKTNIKQLVLAGLAGAVLAPGLHAQTTSLFFVGGNATVKLVQNRWSTLFGGTLAANSTNSNIFRYTGSTVPGVAGTVTADFNLTGGARSHPGFAKPKPGTLSYSRNTQYLFRPPPSARCL